MKNKAITFYVDPNGFPSAHIEIKAQAGENHPFPGLKLHPKTHKIQAFSIQSILKILTLGRLGLFYSIAKDTPDSSYQLAKRVNRDPGNVFKDLKVLEALGLIELQTYSSEGREKVRPQALYEQVILDFGRA